jgi:hypothetical protein
VGGGFRRVLAHFVRPSVILSFGARDVRFVLVED